MDTTRRTFLISGVAALVAAPAVIRIPGLLMPVRDRTSYVLVRGLRGLHLTMTFFENELDQLLWIPHASVKATLSTRLLDGIPAWKCRGWKEVLVRVPKEVYNNSNIINPDPLGRTLMSNLYADDILNNTMNMELKDARLEQINQQMTIVLG